MKLVVDAVISTALPECDDPDKVSQTVKAFIDANIPTQLLGLLEKVVMESPQFQNNTSLQNLLIITAIKSDTSRVMTYVTRLNDYTWDKICEHLIQSQLYDEAIASYKKFNQNVEAVKVMLNYKKSIQAASDWAQHFVDAIDSFVKARDTKEYNKVIQLCEEQNQYGALVTFLELAREIQNRDPIIETELCFAYAKTDKLAELEELTSGPNSAREKEVADRCFECKLYKAAKIIYTAIKDYTRLTETLLELNEFKSAIEAARKAGTSSAWKAVNKACVLAGEFSLAQSAGLQVVVEADLITDVIELYENLGYFTQIIQLLEAAMSLERAHGGIFTELAVLYAKHQPEKVLEHLKTYYQKIALFKVIKQLNLMHMWKELTFAYEKYSEYDNAVLVMMEHPSTSWEHGHFKDLISQVSNADILYRSLTFYLNYSPLDLNELLGVIGQKIDSTRVVEMFRRSNNLQLIKTYLASIQSNNIQAVNEALNQMYIEDGDYESLRHSIDSFDLFESVTLARSLEHHECLEFRRIASYIYRKSKRWNEAITLSKKDKLYGDCIETAAQSQKSDIAESLLHYFVDEKLYECFAACTFVCYDLITSDVVLELAWRNNCIDFAMPYLIQSLREQNQIISKLTSQMGDMDEKNRRNERSCANGSFALSGAAGLCAFECAVPRQQQHCELDRRLQHGQQHVRSERRPIRSSSEDIECTEHIQRNELSRKLPNVQRAVSAVLSQKVKINKQKFFTKFRFLYVKEKEKENVATVSERTQSDEVKRRCVEVI
ncbi:Clathrin heavy chain 1 [Histomonas meleagridis]|uniref:Clathrin heavy chain 1 n=1 Tax=Histomonas meleagridis TaxID=135588 RepID=UPI00355A49A3|nr:Clathrin heavy chain 1 [Histomonas meleagridis]